MHRRHQYVSTLFRAKHVDLRLKSMTNSGSITLFDLLLSTVSAGTVNQTERCATFEQAEGFAQGCPLDLSFSLATHLTHNINSELRSRL
jgi:hypothetical protein